MKYTRTLILIMLVAAGSCQDRGELVIDDGTQVPCRMIIRRDACGTTDIGNNLAWLNVLIVTSFNDETGNYKGRIWVKNYDGTDYIVTDMPITTGFSGYHVYTCAGTEAVINDSSFFSSLSNLNLIWLSYCPQPGTTD
jgi:hypothetical protein